LPKTCIFFKRDDYEIAEGLDTEAEKDDFYVNIKSACESGWDFSSRWFIYPEGQFTG